MLFVFQDCPFPFHFCSTVTVFSVNPKKDACLLELVGPAFFCCNGVRRMGTGREAGKILRLKFDTDSITMVFEGRNTVAELMLVLWCRAEPYKKNEPV